MKKINIRIGRLNIGTRGISEDLVISSIGGLDKEILDGILGQRDCLRKKNIVKINKIDSETVKTTSEVGASDLRKIIAKNVVKSLPKNNQMEIVK